MVISDAVVRSWELLAMPTTPNAEAQVNTLAVDIGGTGLKASVLDLSGNMEHDRVRVPTPYPLSPVGLVDEIERLIKPLPSFDRVSVGFPGVVRGGQIVSAPHFVSPHGPGGKPAPKLVQAWDRFDLQTEVERVTGKPTRVANDADVQGSAVVSGEGFEVVLTLGTGLGTAFFLEGKLLPHLEFAHHPFRKGQSYNEAIGEATRKAISRKRASSVVPPHEPKRTSVSPRSTNGRPCATPPSFHHPARRHLERPGDAVHRRPRVGRSRQYLARTEDRFLPGKMTGR